MSDDKCDYPRCRNRLGSGGISYLGKSVCDPCWDKHCTEPSFRAKLKLPPLRERVKVSDVYVFGFSIRELAGIAASVGLSSIPNSKKFAKRAIERALVGRYV